MKKILFILGFVVFVNQYFAQNVGIGTTTPANKLHIVGAGGIDPLRVDGLNMFVSEQNILVVDPVAGIVRYMHIDSLQARLDTTDYNALLTYIRDSLLNDSVFMDSINTDDQNLTLSNDTLYIEDGNWVVLNFSMDTNLIDSLIYAKLDTFYTIISDSLLLDSTWLFKLDSLINSDTIYFNDTSYTLLRDSLLGDSLFRDSIDTDIDSIKFINDTLYLYEDDKVVSVLINPSLDTSLVDSLIYGKFDSVYTYISDSLLLDSVWLATLDSLLRDSIFFNDTSFTLYRDSLIRDSLFLQALRDSIETNIDTGYLLTFDTLILIEDTDTLSIPLDCKNEGRILYVSTEGNNQTAQIGKRCYPFRDPWTAKDSAQAGDVIHVLPGTYTYGDIGSGADREGDGTNLDTTSLCKNGLTYNFEPGARIKASALSVNMPVWWDTTGISLKVYGKGIFIGDSLIGGGIDNQVMLIRPKVNDGNYHFEFDSIKGSGRGVDFRQNIASLYLKGNCIEANWRYTIYIGNINRSGKSRAKLRFDIGVIKEKNGHLWRTFNNCNNVELIENIKVVDIGGYDIFQLENVEHVLNVDLWKYTGPLQSKNIYGLWALTADSNSTLTYNINRMNVLTYAFHTQDCCDATKIADAKVRININYCFQDTSSLSGIAWRMMEMGRNGSGPYIAATTKFIVSGYFETRNNLPVIRINNQNLTGEKWILKDATLITPNANSVQAGASSSNYTLSIQNVVSNKPVDANTVLTGQPITVDPNY